MGTVLVFLDAQILVVLGALVVSLVLDPIIMIALLLELGMLLLDVGVVKEKYPGATWESVNNGGLSYHMTPVSQPIYRSDFFDQLCGACFGLPRRNLVAGGWVNTNTECGTRSIACSQFSSNGATYHGARGCNESQYYPGATVKYKDRLSTVYDTTGEGYRTPADNLYVDEVDTNKMGDCTGFLRRPINGGSYTHASSSGTRSLSGVYCTIARIGGTRGCSKQSILGREYPAVPV